MSSKSLSKGDFIGVRIAGEPMYVPAYVRADGKEIQAKCVFTAYENTGRNDGAGNPISNQHRFTAWGKLADACAKGMSKGKEFSAFTSPQSYKGKVYYKGVNDTPGVQVMELDGTPMERWQTSYTINEMTFGNDAAAFVAKQIAERVRGPQWDKIGTQDAANWEAVKGQIKATQYIPGALKFGHARVQVSKDATAIAPSAAPDPAAVANTFAGNAQLPAGYVLNAQGIPIPAPDPAVIAAAAAAAAAPTSLF